MSTPLVDVRDLTIGWGEVVLQKNASFQVERGDIFVILGGSGCGKSTLLRYLVGLESPTHGEIIVDGKGPVRLGVGRPPFGVMFQSGALLGSMTVEDNVGLPLREWTDLPPEAISAVVQAKLRLVGLQGTEEKAPSELSGGMRKRAAIARAMALEPELIFLDASHPQVSTRSRRRSSTSYLSHLTKSLVSPWSWSRMTSRASLR
jgi:phospholipid/cholesterol/gamma-HCH transport system ATP-binding protein